MKLTRKINLINGYSNFYSIGQIYNNQTMFKYLNLETAIVCIENGILRFSEPDVWRDSFESRFYSADYKNLKHCPATDTPKLYACCFTYKKMSEAAWTTYNANQKGLGAKCAQFVINVAAFRQILNQAIGNNDSVYEGRVEYNIGDSVIANLHTCKSQYHTELHNKFSLNLYMSLLLLKRSAFSHEKEIRFFINRSGDDLKCQSHFDAKMDWAKVISKIYLAEDVSDVEMKIFKDICIDKGISSNIITRQSIYGKSTGKHIIFAK